MGQTFSNLLVHLVFSTKERARLITPEVRPRLYAYMGGIACGNKYFLLHSVGIEPTRVALSGLRGCGARGPGARSLRSLTPGYCRTALRAGRGDGLLTRL